MRIGAIFPQTEIGNDPVAIRDYAQAIEGLGFSHLMAIPRRGSRSSAVGRRKAPATSP
jgi:hypothetical protein